jgi:hypothetical protein
MPSGLTAGGGGLIFTPEALKSYVETELAKLPAGKWGAFVSYYTLAGRWKLVVVQRIGGAWTLGATVERDLARGVRGGVVVSGSW